MSIKQISQEVSPEASAQNVLQLVEKTGNLYEALAVISARSRQINREIKMELNNKLEEFTESSDTIEEVMENKEQNEISKTYERMANQALIATAQYKSGDLLSRYRYKEDQIEEQNWLLYTHQDTQE